MRHTYIISYTSAHEFKYIRYNISPSQLAPIVGLNFPHSFIEVGEYVSHTVFSYSYKYKKEYILQIHLQLYYLGSASGFYFIYDFCLYDKMSSEMAYFLRYIPLFVGVFVVTIVAVTKRVLKVIKIPSYVYEWVWRRVRIKETIIDEC